jgi:hypothetical protein
MKYPRLDRSSWSYRLLLVLLPDICSPNYNCRCVERGRGWRERWSLMRTVSHAANHTIEDEARIPAVAVSTPTTRGRTGTTSVEQMGMSTFELRANKYRGVGGRGSNQRRQKFRKAESKTSLKQQSYLWCKLRQEPYNIQMKKGKRVGWTFIVHSLDVGNDRSPPPLRLFSPSRSAREYGWRRNRVK